MKIFIKLLISGIFLLPDFLFAQSKLDLLLQEINYVSSKDKVIKSINIQNDTNWIMLYGQNEFSATKLDSSQINLLNNFGKKNQSIFQIIQNDSLLIILHQNGLICKACDSVLTQKFNELKFRKNSIQYVFLSNSSYIILYNFNDFFADKQYIGLQAKIDEINKKYLKIKQIIVFENQWIVSYGKSGIAASYLPPELIKGIDEIKQQQQQIEFITKYNNLWLIIYDRNKLKSIQL